MKVSEVFTVVGGDRRTEYLTRFLSREYPVIRWHAGQSFDSLAHALLSGEHLIFPMPFSKDGIHLSGAENCEWTSADLLPLLSQQHRTLFGGLLPDRLCKHCEMLGIRCFDFAKAEDVALPNAVLTAEGAIAETILLANRSLHARRCLVLGWGRCAKCLAKRLRYLAGSVSVAARDPLQRLQAQCEGFSVFSPEEQNDALPEYDLIFNTVPALMLRDHYTRRLSEECVFLDLASGAPEMHIDAGAFPGQILACPGLPGKYFPKDAGEILAKAILSRIPIS